MTAAPPKVERAVSGALLMVAELHSPSVLGSLQLSKINNIYK